MNSHGLGTESKKSFPVMRETLKNVSAAKENTDQLKPKGFKQSVYSLSLSTLAINVLSLALPVMTLQVYDRILPNPGSGTLPVLVTGVCLAICFEAVLRLCRAYVIGRASAAYEHRMACSTMKTILNADICKMESYGVGEYLQRMASVGKLKDFYNGHSLTVFIELAFVPLFFALIVYIGQTLAIVPATILILFVAVSLLKGLSLRTALKEREVSDDKRFDFLIETLRGVHTVKAFALEKFFQRRYEAMEEDSTYKNYRVTQETSDTFNTGAIFSNLMVACVISAGAWFVLNGMLTTGGLIAVLLLSGRMMQPIQKTLALWARYQDYALARDNVMKLFKTPQRKVMPRETEQSVLSNGQLEIKNLSFKYKNDETPTLKNINLEMKKGDTVLISGAHGTGKTTLLHLIAGIYQPSEGEIFIDEQNANTYAPQELVRHVGYIQSLPLIFRGSIRDNITSFGQIEESAAREIASLLHIDKDIAKLPGGFDTYLSGTNTDVIPPGLKQRISIVRALAHKPRLILFDNADRSLDKEGYAMIYSLLARLKDKVSMILISDDQNIRHLSEQHYELKDGLLHRRETESTRTNVRPYKELRL